jgi:hypothetical protein
VNYRVVYDVLDDVAIPSHTAALFFLGTAIFITVGWVVLTYCIRKTNPERGLSMRPGVVIGTILICVGVLQVAGGTYPVYRDQQQCKEWLRSGQCDTAEGVVAEFHRESGKYPPTHFRVGDMRLSYKTYEPTTGGFRGGFTAPGTEDLKLRDGLRVRIAHRDGRILRVEVGE